MTATAPEPLPRAGRTDDLYLALMACQPTLVVLHPKVRRNLAVTLSPEMSRDGRKRMFVNPAHRDAITAAARSGLAVELETE